VGRDRPGEFAAANPDQQGRTGLPGTYTGPSLFVTGARSDYVLPEHRPIIRSHFPAARFVPIKYAGHWVHVGNPAGVLSVMKAVLHDWR
jgi:esterase